MNQWLIRTEDFWIAGPYSTEQIKQFIHENKINPDDELGFANGYWFALRDTNEVQQHFDLKLQFLAPKTSEEITRTQTQNQTKTQTYSQLNNLKEQEVTPIDLSRQKLRFEKVSLWKGAAFILLAAVVGLLFVVSKVIHR